MPGVGKLLIYNPDDLKNRTSRGDNILADKNAFTFANLKPAPELHGTIFAFGEHRPCIELATNLLANDNPPQGRRDHDINLTVFEMTCYRATECYRVLRILKDLRTLEILVAMQARGELEVPVKQSTGFLEDGKNLLAIHEVKRERNAGNRIELSRAI